MRTIKKTNATNTTTAAIPKPPCQFVMHSQVGEESESPSRIPIAFCWVRSHATQHSEFLHFPVLSASSPVPSSRACAVCNMHTAAATALSSFYSALPRSKCNTWDRLVFKITSGDNILRPNTLTICHWFDTEGSPPVSLITSMFIRMWVYMALRLYALPSPSYPLLMTGELREHATYCHAGYPLTPTTTWLRD